MNRRKQKLVRMDLQLTVVFITLFVSCFVLLINFQLVLAALWSLSTHATGAEGAEGVLESVRSSIVHRFFLSLGIAVPLSISVGVLYSFKFSGPIYRFKKHFRELVRGRWDRPCGLRKGDLLTDLRDAINEAVDQLRGRVEAQHQLIKDVSTFLDECVVSPDGATRHRLEQLRARIDLEDAAYAERLGPVDSGKSTEVSAESQKEAAATVAR